MMLNKNWICFSRRAGMRHDRVGRAEVAKAEWDHKGRALISLRIFYMRFDITRCIKKIFEVWY
jgi:hypothetical protein